MWKDKGPVAVRIIYNKVVELKLSGFKTYLKILVFRYHGPGIKVSISETKHRDRNEYGIGVNTSQKKMSK